MIVNFNLDTYVRYLVQIFASYFFYARKVLNSALQVVLCLIIIYRKKLAFFKLFYRIEEFESVFSHFFETIAPRGRSIFSKNVCLTPVFALK